MAHVRQSWKGKGSDRRIFNIIDIGDFLIAFIKDVTTGEFEMIYNLFDMNSRIWLEGEFDDLSCRNERNGLPVGPEMEMFMINESTIGVICKNSSICDLYLINVERTKQHERPIILSIFHHISLRPKHKPDDVAFGCNVLLGNGRIIIVTEEVEIDRDSIRVHSVESDGQIKTIGSMNNLVQYQLSSDPSPFSLFMLTPDDNVLIIPIDTDDSTINGSYGFTFDVSTGVEDRREIEGHKQGDEKLFPRLIKDQFGRVRYIVRDYRLILIDLNGSLWSLDLHSMQWTQHPAQAIDKVLACPFFLSHTGRLSYVVEDRLGYNTLFLVDWMNIQPKSLWELAVDSLHDNGLFLRLPNFIHNIFNCNQSGDLSNAFVRALSHTVNTSD